MRFIKLGIISFILLSILVTVISLLLPSHIVIRRSVDIQAPLAIVQTKLSDLNHWKYWIVNRDSLPLRVVAKPNGKVLTMGNTEVSINSLDSNSIRTDFIINSANKLPAYITLISNDGNSTTVQWDFEQNIGWYPWDKFASVASDKVLGSFADGCLNNLKRHIEEIQ